MSIGEIDLIDKSAGWSFTIGKNAHHPITLLSGRVRVHSGSDCALIEELELIWYN